MKKKTSKKAVASKSSPYFLHKGEGGAQPKLKAWYDASFVPTKDYLAQMPDLMRAEAAIAGARVPIQQVGIAGFRIPLQYRAKGGRIHTLETRVTGTVSLEASKKGINMSRILRSFYEGRGRQFTLERLGDCLEELRTRVGTMGARLRLSFSFPMLQRSLRSGLEGWQYYTVTLEGRLEDDGRFRRFVEFDFVYSSACPCSAELSEHAREVRGAYAVPHSQRSRARVRVELAEGKRMEIEELHSHCLAALVTETQVLVKREDEQAFAELNGAHLKFVEDAVRLLHGRLDSDPRIRDFEAVCVHLESLHSHDAVGVTCKGVEGGMRAEFSDFGALVC